MVKHPPAQDSESVRFQSLEASFPRNCHRKSTGGLPTLRAIPPGTPKLPRGQRPRTRWPVEKHSVPIDFCRAVKLTSPTTPEPGAAEGHHASPVAMPTATPDPLQESGAGTVARFGELSATLDTGGMSQTPARPSTIPLAQRFPKQRSQRRERNALRQSAPRISNGVILRLILRGRVMELDGGKKCGFP